MECRSSLLVPLALMALCPFSAPSASQQAENILVTATRLDTHNTRARGSVTIITSDDIEHSTARTLPELLGREAGVLARSLFGNNGSRATVDIRGFGAAATQNTLILLDGRRLNDIDLSAVDYSAIPLESIDRIEIIRNGGAVLYGDGAVGGTINIITRRPEETGTTGFMKGGIGNLDTRQLDAHLSHSAGAVAVFMGAHGISSDGYRDNNSLDQSSLQGDIRHTRERGETYVKLYWDDQDLDLPGERRVDPNTGLDQLRDDRKGTNTPNDYANTRGYNTTAGFTHLWDNGAEAVIDFGYRKKNQKAFFDDYDFGGDFANYVDSDLKTWSLTPRLILPYTLHGAEAQTITGFDYYDSQYDSDRSQNPDVRNQPIHRIDVEQKSASIYLDTVISPAADLHFNLGGRLQWVRVEAEDDVDTTAPGGGLASEAPDFDNTDWVEMLEAGVEKQVNGSSTVYVKATRSARVATVDELFQVSPTTFLQVFSDLDPQTSNGVDIGVAYAHETLSLKANTYYMRLKDEIQFDPNTFSNVNLDPTKRYGIELSGRIAVHRDVVFQANYTYMRSVFRDGPFDGNDVPLVPRHTASAMTTWNASPSTEFTAAINFVGEQYFDNDQANDFGKKIPSYETVDFQGTHHYAGFSFTAQVNNLLDKNNYNYGVSSTTTAGRYNAYPLAERTYLFTVSRDFGI